MENSRARMVACMKGNIKITICRVKADIPMLTVMCLKDNILMGKRTVMENLHTLTVIYTKEILRTINIMVGDSIRMLMGIFMMVIGKRMFSMVLADIFMPMEGCHVVNTLKEC
jgi:hypothetical protein